MKISRLIAGSLLLLFAALAHAGAQKEEALSSSVQTAMQRSINDALQPKLMFANEAEGQAWLEAMSARIAKRVPDAFMRKRLLTAIHYEATRAGLDPQLVLGLIYVESGFNRYAVSSVGARGLMQVMPFWVRQIGHSRHNLFDVHTNLRFGCTILRHYLDIENGDLFRALGRYNGSLGRAEYPNAVHAAWKKFFAWDGQGKSLPLR
ncbi:Transglycosylase SLT domain-containing protein [Formivibrio citricus]|uniref:Transglycosylase SLT domain-containing protein n=1 Tax=Formivibrio citricus TaxID=83765 RepID=A0A1I5A6V5_9NEIS|nr:lytic transglycosylase domain-containing protein [Formivibrio citricus]SFN58261.1 Transglycosylase SLT domain-containing protein [Formivibrio citricus]